MSEGGRTDCHQGFKIYVSGFIVGVGTEGKRENGTEVR